MKASSFAACAAVILTYAIACAFILAPSAHSAEEVVKVADHLPPKPPVTVVVLAQCGHTLGFYATMSDGELLAFDMTSKVSFEDVYAWAMKATKRTVTEEAKCTVEDTETVETF